ncbi:MAG: hypothetical protein PHQ54_03810 [Candidatus Omnitrophica bacterium]|nr:hypothetical protein [Candidatus Omnitrophota bacterium]
MNKKNARKNAKKGTIKNAKKDSQNINVCHICSKEKKSDKNIKCCGKDMFTPEKGAWDF